MKKKDGKGRTDTGPGIFSLLKPYKGWIALLVLTALIGNAVNLILPRIIADTIDDFGAGHFSIRTLVISFGLASVIIFVFTYLQSILQTYASEKVARDLRTGLSSAISRQSYSYVIQANPNKLLTNLTSDVDSIKSFVSQAVATIITSIFVIVATSILLLSINWRLALVVLTIIPLIGGTFFFVLTRVRVLFKKSREIIDKLNKVINESILGAPLIRVINSQNLEIEKFTHTNSEALNLGLSILRMFSLMIPIIMFVSNLAIIAILSLGGHFVVQGSMTLGNFAAFYSYLGLLIFPILMIGFMSNIIAQASASYGRISALMQAQVPEPGGTCRDQLTGKIEIRNVSLSFDEKPVLKNISFTIEPGSRTAIIGPTAAGKSQLLYILSHIILPGNGEVLYDGKPIEWYQSESFHRQVGFVFQDSVIFQMSLRENIAFRGEVSEEALEKAIETAGLKEFIDTLPGKLETVISERGSNLSGGQKQRIMLARALVLEPRILLLDDFTARIDRKTENRILCNIENNYPELTIVSVTQKIASIKHFEKIIFLMEGEVIAEGNHKALLESCPEYVQVNNSQRSTSHYEL
ncbi:MAG: ABC transporter ATP-binding protein [Bacteroidales bacterium]